MRGVNVSVAAGLEDFGDEEVIHRGVRAEENAAVVVERGAGVFHTAVLEVGQDHEVVLRERVGDAGVGLEPLERVKHEFEDLKRG